MWRSVCRWRQHRGAGGIKLEEGALWRRFLAWTHSTVQDMPFFSALWCVMVALVAKRGERSETCGVVAYVATGEMVTFCRHCPAVVLAWRYVSVYLRTQEA